MADGMYGHHTFVGTRSEPLQVLNRAPSFVALTALAGLCDVSAGKFERAPAVGRFTQPLSGATRRRLSLLAFTRNSSTLASLSFGTVFVHAVHRVTAVETVSGATDGSKVAWCRKLLASLTVATSATPKTFTNNMGGLINLPGLGDTSAFRGAFVDATSILANYTRDSNGIMVRNVTGGWAEFDFDAEGAEGLIIELPRFDADNGLVGVLHGL